ncbi:MFS transporter [Acetobacter estunensis]|uniref:MFS transporter n=2 Tax=Acetobacter estunensis TaxID=104097 RepID=A0A967B596_9PROT|nr:MFS transporter [Acetobacter estunensis]
MLLTETVPSVLTSASLATRLSFFTSGFAFACWAPLVPFARARLGVDTGAMGLLLLCLGLGSVLAMLLAGWLCARHGARPVIVVGGLSLMLILPFLAVASTPLTLGASLLLFGGALGSMDVAMNIHGVEVERGLNRPLMSGFHAQFSLGGCIGAGLMTFLLSLWPHPFVGTLLCAGVILTAMGMTAPRLLRAAAGEVGAAFAWPRGIVLLLAGLAGLLFLVEGAVLDWGALLITSSGLVPVARGGLAYMLFAVAMTVGRLGGDALTTRIGDVAVLAGGGLLSVAGFVVLLTVSVPAVALAGFGLIGLGASNIVPLLYRQAGLQAVMPTGAAVTALTLVGYAGILLGPAVIGFVAQFVGLRTAFWGLGALMGLLPFCARFATARKRVT